MNTGGVIWTSPTNQKPMNLDMDKTTFNRNWIIKFYPKPNQQWRSRLVGVDRMREIIADDEVFENKMTKIEQSTGDEVVIKLRRGVMFKIIAK